MHKNATFALRGKTFMVFIFSLVVGQAMAQISTPQSLKYACETSPGNVVTITQSVKVFAQTALVAPVVANCSCTIVLTNSSTIEFENANMRFTGALAIQSAGQGEAKLVRSILSAPAISFNLGGAGSQMNTSDSKIEATAGNLTITLGTQAKSEMSKSISPSFIDGLSATGVVNISAGERFSGSLAELTIAGNAGVNIALSGVETLLKVEKVTFKSSAGSSIISMSGTKGLLEMKESGFFFHNESKLLLNGAESTIKMERTFFNGPTYGVSSIGGVTIVAGSGTAGLGKVELGGVSANLIGGGFDVRASLGGSVGGVKFEKGLLNVSGAILFETGALGSTEVKENRLTSGVKITVKTGAGGNCVAAPNLSMDAPVVEACQPMVALMTNNNSSATQKAAAQNVTLFPNPGTGNAINMKFNNTAEEVEVRIVDTQGRLVRQLTAFGDRTMRVDGLQPGFYYAQILDKMTGTQSSQKFVIAN